MSGARNSTWTRTEEENNGVSYTNKDKNSDVFNIVIKPGEQFFKGLGLQLFIVTSNKDIHKTYRSAAINFLTKSSDVNRYMVNLFIYISEIESLLVFLKNLETTQTISNHILESLKEDVLKLAKKIPTLEFKDTLSDLVKINAENISNVIAEKTLNENKLQNIAVRYSLGEYLFNLYQENKIKSDLVSNLYNALMTMQEEKNIKPFLELIKKLVQKRLIDINKIEERNNKRETFKKNVITLFYKKQSVLPKDIVIEVSKYLDVNDCNILLRMFKQNIEEKTRGERLNELDKKNRPCQ